MLTLPRLSSHIDFGVITNQGIQIGLKMAKSGGQQRTEALVATLIRKGLDRNDLLSSISNPIRFRPGVGVTAYGYEATVLADLCKVPKVSRHPKLTHYPTSFASVLSISSGSLSNPSITVLRARSP